MAGGGLTAKPQVGSLACRVVIHCHQTLGHYVAFLIFIVMAVSGRYNGKDFRRFLWLFSFLFGENRNHGQFYDDTNMDYVEEELWRNRHLRFSITNRHPLQFQSRQQQTAIP